MEKNLGENTSKKTGNSAPEVRGKTEEAFKENGGIISLQHRKGGKFNDEPLEGWGVLSHRTGKRNKKKEIFKLI